MDQMDQNVGRKMATVSYVLVEWLNKSRSHKGGSRGKGENGAERTERPQTVYVLRIRHVGRAICI